MRDVGGEGRGRLAPKASGLLLNLYKIWFRVPALYFYLLITMRPDIYFAANLGDSVFGGAVLL